MENGVVVGNDGSDIGKVGQVYTDNDTGAPSWVTVKTGWVGTRESFVPLNSATVDGDSIQVPFDKDTIKGAPHNEAGEPLSEEDERELYSYYGFDSDSDVGTDRAERPYNETKYNETKYIETNYTETNYTEANYTETTYTEGDGSGREFESADSAGTLAEIPTQRVSDNADGGGYLTRSEEQLQVGTERVEAGRAQLRKFVVTEQQTVTVPVSREEVRVVREPIEPGDSVDDVTIGEDAADVVLTAERVVVGKGTVPVEKVSLGTETVTGHRDVTEGVRKEQIEFDESPPPKTGSETCAIPELEPSSMRGCVWPCRTRPRFSLRGARSGNSHYTDPEVRRPTTTKWSLAMSTPVTSPTGDEAGSRDDAASRADTASVQNPKTTTNTADELPLPEPTNLPPVIDPPSRAEPRVIPVAPDRATVVARQQERFGGIKVGSAFFGWLTATGMAVILLALLTAAGVAFGVATDTSVDQAVQESQNGTGTAQTVGLVGAIALLVVLLLAYYCGGYVAGRMARFNGIRQGLAVWLWGVLITLLIAAVAAIAGAQYDVFAQLNLPRLPVNEGDVTTVGAIAIGAAILASLIGALLGGLAGMRFHRKVDAAGLEPLERESPAAAVGGELG